MHSNIYYFYKAGGNINFPFNALAGLWCFVAGDPSNFGADEGG